MASGGFIFDIQRFSVHDGPGIRTTVFFKGCPLRCPWCQNPESLRTGPELFFFSDRCHGSGECVSRCERQALGPGVERVARDLCDGCGRCVDACAWGALEVVGRSVTADALVEELLRDRPFFQASGGGVTLSGGEPTFQPELAADLAARLKAKGVSCGLQTCGMFRWDTFAPHLPLFDFVHFDLKLMLPEQHRALLGGDNHTILQNARRMVAAGVEVLFRAPMVPGYTDTPENLAGIAALLRECGASRLHLLAYHPMGEAKRARIGAPIPPLAVRERLDRQTLLGRATERLRGHGVEVTA